ncbi:uncharacterized protein TRIVIDRAFT_66857 [Trichoderma virens Gv29-8]|uniref:Transcription factor domain-containing protein n=1 Tax=Hypocrea virens (strain Gv29-8 / FGSC 10586) TaxID=413071 RepID=G9N3E6_HYPVG|nr:uncharacterized protein TRIVIDRAFT_66857 [Trichoderma virens Gv29-8]EHK18830.1 hypothetical protein TRIVIDRAFT_66857 [Trichoderma virens Gv29-8]UKZ56607.1 hypothetical protein TrVGV298_010446 [Trichoderma virens]
MDYIDELEAEIFRLRASVTTMSDESRNPRRAPSSSQNALQTINNVNINVHIQSFNGQIATGIFSSSYPSTADPCIVENLLASDAFGFESTTIPQSIELFDPLTRMLFYNFSENIAPTLVAIDGLSNGYRTMILPLACSNDLVRSATLAASANHLRFQRPKLSPLASRLQSTAVEKLSVFSRDETANGATRSAVLAAIILMLITDMMNGGQQFYLLVNMAKSWVAAMKHGSPPTASSRSVIEQFLLNQLEILQLYAEPLLKEQYAILAQHDSQTTSDDKTFKDRILSIFKAIEEAIKQACNIYSSHILHNAPPANIEETLDNLKITVDGIPAYAPGENSLAWVYFIAAAESSAPAKRNFFSKKLMGIFERGAFTNTTTAFVMLHHIWNCREMGDNWTKTLKQTPTVLVLT